MLRSRVKDAVSRKPGPPGRYAANLTLGLISAFFFFMYHVYQLLVNYGEARVWHVGTLVSQGLYGDLFNER